MQALQRHWGSLQVLHLTTDGGHTGDIVFFSHLVEFRGASLRASELVKRSGTHSNSDSLSESPLIACPWVCLKLEVLRITVLRTVDGSDLDELFHQLCQLKRLREIHLCENKRIFASGFDIWIRLGLGSVPKRFKGECRDPRGIKGEPSGPRFLLEIWPELTSCSFFKREIRSCQHSVPLALPSSPIAIDRGQ